MNELMVLINEHITQNSEFAKATFSGIRQTNKDNSFNKITIEKVIDKTKTFFQVNSLTTIDCITKNYGSTEINEKLKEISNLGFSSIYIRSLSTGIQVKITKKNKILIRKHKNLDPIHAKQSHDNKKDKIVSNKKSYLQVLEITDKHNSIKPSMQSKYKQINEFIKIVKKTIDWKNLEELNVLDCGSGNGYLTLSIYDYFYNDLNIKANVIGIDIDASLVERNNSRVNKLGWDNINFEISNIIGYQSNKKIDLLLALHACDTATDEALYLAIKNKAQNVLCVPCCHHDIQSQLKNSNYSQPICDIQKHGILIERQGDIIADTMRSLILEIFGYKTNLIQYVSDSHTAKNIMIKATKISKLPLENSIKNYYKYKKFWQTTPALERIIKKSNIEFPAEEI